MTEKNNGIGEFPNVHIKPYDGMAITADVWAAAHEEHRQARKAHDLALHGSGIIIGLEVIPNDPSDQLVFINPGVAIDTAGNVIVLEEKVAYDFGTASAGELFLLLGHGEREIGGVDEDIRYLQDEYIISARSSLPKRPYVELARVKLTSAGAALKPAADPNHPKLDELDLRFRRQIAVETPKKVRVAVSGLGGEDVSVGQGWDYLAEVVRRSTAYELIIDQNVPGSEALSKYDMVYFGCFGTYDLDEVQQKQIKAFLSEGNQVIFESFTDEADASCQAALQKLGVSPVALQKDNALLKSPYLFGNLPAGARGDQVDFGDGVIFSRAGFALAWAGVFQDGGGSRELIRSAQEWGVNVIVNGIPK